MSWFFPAFWLRDSNIYLVLSATNMVMSLNTPMPSMGTQGRTKFFCFVLSHVFDGVPHSMFLPNLINFGPPLVTFIGGSRDSVVGIMTGYGLDGRGIGVWFLAGTRTFLHIIQTRTGAHSVSFSVGIRASFLGCKAVASWNCPLASIQCRD
jgi:hypothetical protein